MPSNKMPRLRKSLQTLQQTGKNQHVLVGSSGILEVKTNLPEKDMTNKRGTQKTAVLADYTEKENSPVVVMPRRSQRKNALKTSQSSLCTIKKAFSKSCAAKTLDVKGTVSNLPNSTGSKMLAVVQNSVESLATISEENDATATTSTEQAILAMTTDYIPPDYWKDIAEQRRLALVTALATNEDLYDQIEVFEIDNKNLQAIVDLGEKLASMLQGLLK